MSDYQDFCKTYGGSANDSDFMDNWLDKYARDAGTEKKVTPYTKNPELISTNILPKGKLIHMVKLTGRKPAKALKVIWDIKLENDQSCNKANYLSGRDYEDPARWFIAKGFTVRSMKENNHWFQVAFKDSNEATALSDKQKREYESIAFESGFRAKK